MNNKQESILHLASVKGFIDIVSYLLTIGANVDASDL